MGYFKSLRFQDFRKLTNEDLKKIKEFLPEIKEVDDKKLWLYENREALIKNEEVTKIISNKVFAGKVTIKLYKINDNIDKEKVIEILEGDSFNYNKCNLNSNDAISIYSTLKIQEGKYVIRVMYRNGTRYDDNQDGKIPDIKYIDVVLDIETGIIEVRTEINKAKKIIEYIKGKLSMRNVDGIRVLSKYNNIEEFAKAINGNFKKIFSNTSIQIDELNSNDVLALGELVLALDDYLINKDTDNFVEKLETIKFETEGITFTQTFLAGCNQIGISVSNKENKDLSNQGLYKILNKHLSNDNGYISFKLKDGDKDSTIRLSTGINKNTVQFISSVNEEEIEMILSNIITLESSAGLDTDEVIALSKDIVEFIENKNTNAIRIEHLVNNFNLSESTVIDILEGYVKKEMLERKFEVVCEKDASVLLEINDINNIKETLTLECPVCEESYTIDYSKMMLEENMDIINLVYVKTQRGYCELESQDREINTKMVSQLLEEQLNINEESDCKESCKVKTTPFKVLMKVASVLF